MVEWIFVVLRMVLPPKVVYAVTGRKAAGKDTAIGYFKESGKVKSILSSDPVNFVLDLFYGGTREWDYSSQVYTMFHRFFRGEGWVVGLRIFEMVFTTKRVIMFGSVKRAAQVEVLKRWMPRLGYELVPLIVEADDTVRLARICERARSEEERNMTMDQMLRKENTDPNEDILGVCRAFGESAVRIDNSSSDHGANMLAQLQQDLDWRLARLTFGAQVPEPPPHAVRV